MEVGKQVEKNLMMDLMVVVPGQQAMYNGVKAFISIFLVGSYLASKRCQKRKSLNYPTNSGGPGEAVGRQAGGEGPHRYGSVVPA